VNNVKNPITSRASGSILVTPEDVARVASVALELALTQQEPGAPTIKMGDGNDADHAFCIDPSAAIQLLELALASVSQALDPDILGRHLTKEEADIPRLVVRRALSMLAERKAALLYRPEPTASPQ
jgi:hypothetical protein